MVPAAALLPLVLERLAQALHLVAHAVELARRLGQAHQALGADGPTRQSKGRSRRSVAPASSAASASRGPEQRARMGTRDQGADVRGPGRGCAALVAQRHVGEDDDRPVAPNCIEGSRALGRRDHLEPGAGQPARGALCVELSAHATRATRRVRSGRASSGRSRPRRRSESQEVPLCASIRMGHAVTVMGALSPRLRVLHPEGERRGSWASRRPCSGSRTRPRPCSGHSSPSGQRTRSRARARVTGQSSPVGHSSPADQTTDW